MKNKLNTCKCPLCGKNLVKYKMYRHFRNDCLFKNSISLYEYMCKVEGKEIVDLVIQKYIDGYPFYELHRSTVRNTLSEIPGIALRQLFKELNIQHRTISDSKQSCITQEKYKNTFESLYGYGITNISQVSEIKQKKAETFIKHYGVDNIRKYKPFYDYVNDYMIKTYGKKRLSGWEKLTNEEREQRSKRQFETRVVNGYYDSKLEERIDKILTDNNIKHRRCFWLYHHPYDFILDNYLLLEINGDYWHANPNIYKADDLMSNGKLAKDIWAYDKKFKDCLQNSKFNLIYLWESDMNKMSDDEILQWIKKQIEKYEN